jgi:hypothetical protein
MEYDRSEDVMQDAEGLIFHFTTYPVADVLKTLETEFLNLDGSTMDVSILLLGMFVGRTFASAGRSELGIHIEAELMKHIDRIGNQHRRTGGEGE